MGILATAFSCTISNCFAHFFSRSAVRSNSFLRSNCYLPWIGVNAWTCTAFAIFLEYA